MALGVPPARAQVVTQTVTIDRQTPDMRGFQMLAPGRTPKTGTGRLRGRVVAGDTGGAIRRAQVRISGPDIGTKTALTDGQGHYEFSELPAGRFTLSVSKSGYVTMQYGQTHPFEAGRPLDLADAQVMDKVDVALPRGSVLAGRVVDEFGDPVADANVSAMRMQYMNGRRRLMPAGRNATTNDLGQFRIFGLPPGEYYVSATLRSMDAMVFDMLGASAGGPVGSNQNSGYAATYYPGTANPSEAQRLSLDIGQELSNVDLQLQPARLAKIIGTIMASDGKPMPGAMVMLMPTNKDAVQLMPGGTARTDKDGNFTLSGVAPGDYTLQAQSLAGLMSAASDAMVIISGDASSSRAPSSGPEQREFAMADVSVAGDDIKGLVITATRGAHASGRLVFDGATPPQDLSQLHLVAAPTDADSAGPMMSMLGNSAVKDEGTFEMDGLMGRRRLAFISDPKGWHIKRVLTDDGDVTDSGIDFKPGGDVSGIVIELTDKTTTITGSATDDRGQALKDYTVVVFTQDRQKWPNALNRWARSTRPDQSGQFRIANLPAGEYFAVATDYVASGDWQDPDWLERATKNATPFTIEDGGTKTLELKLSR